MHVVILCDFAVPTGGSQKVAIESARALADAGVRVTFVHAVAGRDGALDHPFITCTCIGLEDVWNRPMVAAALSGIWNRASRSALTARTVSTGPPGETIIHLHQWTRAFSPAIIATALASKRPLVVTAHDYFLSCPNGVYYRFDLQRPCALRPLSVGCLTAGCDPKSPAHKAIRVLRGFATAAAISGSSFDIVHVSDRGRDTLAPLLPNGLRHHRIDNPIDMPQTAPAEIKPDARFAYIGRLTREKGAVLAAAAASLSKRSICFIGDGPAEAEIRAVNPSAEILGWRSRAEVAALLGGSISAVVAPSLWDETGPLTVAEAAAAGIGAIASNRCGAAERIVEGVSGFVVDPDARPLAAAMTALGTPATAQAFGRAAYAKYWADPPTPAAHAAVLIDLYAKILGRPIP